MSRASAAGDPRSGRRFRAPRPKSGCGFPFALLPRFVCMVQVTSKLHAYFPNTPIWVCLFQPPLPPRQLSGFPLVCLEAKTPGFPFWLLALVGKWVELVYLVVSSPTTETHLFPPKGHQMAVVFLLLACPKRIVQILTFWFSNVGHFFGTGPKRLAFYFAILWATEFGCPLKPAQKDGINSERKRHPNAQLCTNPKNLPISFWGCQGYTDFFLFFFYFLFFFGGVVL